MLQGMVESLPAHDMPTRLAFLVKATGKKQKEVAELLGVTPQAVSGWLRTGRISTESLVRLAALAGMTVEEALGTQGVREASAPYASSDSPQTLAAALSHSVRLDPATITGAIRVLQIVFGRRGVTVNLAEQEFAELFAAAYEALDEMKGQKDAELQLTAQVIDLIAAREARSRGQEGEQTGGPDRATARRKGAA